MVSVAIDPPPSSQRERPRRGLLAFAFSAAIAVSLAAGFWLGRITAPSRGAPTEASSPASSTATSTSTSPPPTPTPTADGTGTGAPKGAPTGIPTAAAIPAVGTLGPAALPAAGPTLRRLSVTLDGALEGSIASALPAEDRPRAGELTAVVNRLLVWELQVARDGRRGDRLDVLWSPAMAAPGTRASAEPVVQALRYASGKLGGVVAVYRYEPRGARWPRYYRADGSELESRLVDSPVAEYEQITSLLRDGRRHKGVDFKAPVGSPVVAPFDGVIERRNWNFSVNGNCLDIRDPSTGRHAIFLHLDVVPREMRPGRKVRKGEVIAASGNSGRSYAPHVHYQLEDAGGRVLDPFEVLRTERRALPPEERAGFEAARAQLDSGLGG